jgi:hypothetical protein
MAAAPVAALVAGFGGDGAGAVVVPVSALTGISPNLISDTFWPKFLGGLAPPDIVAARTGDSV